MNHKIKINNIEVELTEEQIRELHSRLENKGEKYFFPEDGERFFILASDEVCSDVCDDTSSIDETRIKRGVFRTEEQAKKEDEKRLALVRMWKWVQENGLYFEPDWSDTYSKYYPCRTRSKWEIAESSSIQFSFIFPHFKKESDCQKFIDNNLSDLNLFV